VSCVVTDAIERTRVVGDVVQRAVWSHLQVNHAARLVVEVVHRGDVAARVELGSLDEPLRVVPKEEVAPVLRRERLIPIYRAARYGCALVGVRIRVDWVDVAGAARGALAFMRRRVVVAALDDVIDLLPAEVPYIAPIELPCGAVELEAPGLRNPYAQIASSFPGSPTNGLSAGIEPSMLIRRIFQCGLRRS
jgi:hypothetical protein